MQCHLQKVSPSFPPKVTFWPISFYFYRHTYFSLKFSLLLPHETELSDSCHHWPKTWWNLQEGRFSLAYALEVPVCVWWLCCSWAVVKQSIMVRKARRNKAGQFIAVREHRRNQRVAQARQSPRPCAPTNLLPPTGPCMPKFSKSLKECCQMGTQHSVNGPLWDTSYSNHYKIPM